MMKKNDGNAAVEIMDMIALENELQMLRKERGIKSTGNWLEKFGDWYADRLESRILYEVSYKKYLLLALFLGIFGIHRFYARQYGTAVLYMLTCWTGIPFAMSLVDIIIALPKKQNENGNIEVLIYR